MTEAESPRRVERGFSLGRGAAAPAQDDVGSFREEPAVEAGATGAPLPGVLRLGLLRGRLEVRQFFRSREAVVFTFFFPAMLLAIFGSVLDRDIAPGVRFSQYFLAGMIGAGLLATAFQNLAIQIPIERESGGLKRLHGTPMPPAAYFLGKIILTLFITYTEMAGLFLIGTLFYGVTLPSRLGDWATLTWVSLLGTAACALMGLAFSSLPRNGRAAPAMVTPVAVLLQFVSGVFFVSADLPPWMQQVAAVFPLKWICQGMRSVFLPDSFAAREVTHGWELGRVAIVLSAWTLGGLLLCLLTFRWRSPRER
jgi:ABC-2 type transport system permease protein